MSHSILSTVNPGAFVFIQVQIVNYVVGGEAVTASEFHIGAVDAVLFATIPASQNSLAVPLFPILESGKIKLYRFVSGAPSEISATTNLNATMSALVHVSQSY